MNFGEKMSMVLNKMVVPKYDFIDYVEYKYSPPYNAPSHYCIIFMSKDGTWANLSSDPMIEVVTLTKQIIGLVGLDDNMTCTIHFQESDTVFGTYFYF